MQARSLEKCLIADSAIERLAQHAERLARLQRIVEAVIPFALARSCRVANYKRGVVVIHAENSAVAAKLRQLAVTLRTALLTSGSDITEVVLKVQPRTATSTARPAPQPKALSARAEQALTTLARTIPAESPLGVSLRRLLNQDELHEGRDALEKK